MALTKAKLIELFDAGALDDYVGGGCPHGVGDILQTRNATSPTTRWPGTTWAALEGAFLIGADSTYTAGSTGGEAKHVLTVAELAAHTHLIENPYTANQYLEALSITPASTPGGYIAFGGTADTSEATKITSSGSGAAHNNLPPYKAVYMWERTA